MANSINRFNPFPTFYLQYNESTDAFRFFKQINGKAVPVQAKTVIDLTFYPIAEKHAFSSDDFCTLIKAKMRHDIECARMSLCEKQNANEFWTDSTLPMVHDKFMNLLISKEDKKKEAIISFLEEVTDQNAVCGMRGETLYSFNGAWEGFAFHYITGEDAKVKIS